MEGLALLGMYVYLVGAQLRLRVELGETKATLKPTMYGLGPTVLLHVTPQVKVGHEACTTHRADHPLVIEVHSSHVGAQRLAGLEGHAANVTVVFPQVEVASVVVVIVLFVVEGLLAHRALVAALVGVQGHVVLVCVHGLE